MSIRSKNQATNQKSLVMFKLEKFLSLTQQRQMQQNQVTRITLQLWANSNSRVVRNQTKFAGFRLVFSFVVVFS